VQQTPHANREPDLGIRRARRLDFDDPRTNLRRLELSTLEERDEVHDEFGV